MRPIGHLGGGLVLTAIVIIPFDESVALWFTALAAPASLLPDIDLFLPYFPHQGVIHTYSVMLLVSLVGGLIAAGLYATFTNGRDRDVDGSADFPASSDDSSVAPTRAFALATGALVLGTFTHVTLDLVAYRESFTVQPVEPFWPFTDWVPRINLFPHNAPLWNYGFLALGVTAWIAVYWTKR